MSIYYEKARELGNLILSSEQAKNLADASNSYNESDEAKAKMKVFNDYQADVRKGMQSGEMSKEEIDIATRRLTEMTIELKEYEEIGRLVACENEFNGFVNNVMNVLKATIMGEDSSCSSCEPNEGGCSGCGGGCH